MCIPLAKKAEKEIELVIDKIEEAIIEEVKQELRRLSE